MAQRNTVLVIICLGIAFSQFLVWPVEANDQRLTGSVSRVTHVRVDAKTDTTITLKWKNQPATDRYQIRVFKKNGTRLKTVNTVARRKTIKGLQPDTVYRFRVRAWSNSMTGKFSERLTTRTGQSTPVLFGFWGLNGYLTETGLADVSDRFHTTVFQVASSSPNYTITTLLPLVKAAEMTVTLRLTPDHTAYTTNGNFDLDKWKNELSVWTDTDIQPYIDDGTLAGHMLLDDIDTFSGTDATAEDLEEMARYSKELLPGLMTFVRQRCSHMPQPTSGEYQQVDYCVNQYSNYQGYSNGPVDEYIVTETAAASELQLDMIMGLNIADGGDGSSNQPGWSAGKYAMSAEEILAYGEPLLAVPNIPMFLLWEYDGEETWSDGTIGSNYFDQPNLQAALAHLGELATH